MVNIQELQSVDGKLLLIIKEYHQKGNELLHVYCWSFVKTFLQETLSAYYCVQSQFYTEIDFKSREYLSFFRSFWLDVKQKETNKINTCIKCTQVPFSIQSKWSVIFI